VALAGALAIVTRLDAGSLALRINPGDLLVILSLLMLAGYTVALRWRPGLDALSLRPASLVAESVGIVYAVEYAAAARWC
jgi:hypothetical protein